MKRIIIVLLSLAMLLACVPTPEEEFVVGKNTESMISAAVDPESEHASTGTELGAPERYREELKSAGGHLFVSVDASVSLPDGPLPIVRIDPCGFTEDDINRYLTVLLGDDPYFFEGKLPKSYWQMRLDEAIDAVEHWDTYGMNYFNEYETVEEARKTLDALNKQLNEAPDEPQRVYSDISFQAAQVRRNGVDLQSNDTNLFLRFVDPSGSFGKIDCENMRELFGTASFEYARNYLKCNISMEPVDVSNDLKITQEEAQQKALILVQALGFSDFALVKSCGVNAFYNEPKDYTPIWQFLFTRKIGAGQVTYADMLNTHFGPNYQKAMQDEVLYLGIDDAGLYCMRYQGPMTILETVTEQTHLKPFSEIQSIFERMVLLKNNTADHPDGGEAEYLERYVITNVRLGLVAVREQDKDTALLVPAWDFLGYHEITWPDGTTSIYDRHECYSFLTVNAVDGSIIDRCMGY